MLFLKDGIGVGQLCVSFKFTSFENSPYLKVCNKRSVKWSLMKIVLRKTRLGERNWSECSIKGKVRKTFSHIRQTWLHIPARSYFHSLTHIWISSYHHSSLVICMNSAATVHELRKPTVKTYRCSILSLSISLCPPALTYVVINRRLIKYG